MCDTIEEKFDTATKLVFVIGTSLCRSHVKKCGIIKFLTDIYVTKRFSCPQFFLRTHLADNYWIIFEIFFPSLSVFFYRKQTSAIIGAKNPVFFCKEYAPLESKASLYGFIEGLLYNKVNASIPSIVTWSDK